jgi:hypothetical protein
MAGAAPPRLLAIVASMRPSPNQPERGRPLGVALEPRVPDLDRLAAHASFTERVMQPRLRSEDMVAERRKIVLI